MTFPPDPPPLTADEKARLERKLGPEVLRQILDRDFEMGRDSVTGNANLEFNWNYGKLKDLKWTEILATRFRLK